MSIMQVVGLIVLFLALYGVFLVSCESRIIYHPYKYPDGYWSPSDRSVPAEDVHFSSGDGVRLHGWYVPSPGAKTTLLWFHGNAGNLTHRLDNIKLLQPLKIDVFIFDYRGYGKSEGSPDEAGIYLDSQAAYDWLVQVKKVPPRKIILFGRSLGGVCAIEVASKNQAAGLILESVFPSAAKMARKIFPFLPLDWAIQSRFDAISKVPGLKLPKLFLHGTQDEIVPYELGREVFEAAAEPKAFYDIEGAGHNDTYMTGGSAYFDALARFIKSAVSAEPMKN
ncbi:peptidase [Candidatus Nitromaritima sp. SCGC AAA799-A02]|nr:peptidase [Candidatus Nitromaritima sp. SCGC AAA799-C22]KMP11853.1 peptidase [Candidatus Nitromaritima sp. SCGC AAA799-A02]